LIGWIEGVHCVRVDCIHHEGMNITVHAHYWIHGHCWVWHCPWSRW
jgi:hypothetical protein